MLDGAALGAEEANRTGALFNRKFELVTSSDSIEHAAAFIKSTRPAAILGAFDESELTAISGIAREHRIPLFNVACIADDARAICSPYTLHVAASSSALRRCERRHE